MWLGGGVSSSMLQLESVELRRIALPLVTPFRTSFGTQTSRDVLLVRATTSSGEGWGECVAMDDPLYSSEYVEGAQHVIVHHLLPRLFGQPIAAHLVGELLEPVRGHPMAKAAVEMAVLDAELRDHDLSLARYLGATQEQIPSGVSVGIFDTLDGLLGAVRGYLDAGYVRIKLKIEPGIDIDRVRAVRAEFGDAVALQVDANTAYTRADTRHLARLDEYGLLLIEQPLPEDDIVGHAQLAAAIQTPVCLDESIVSARAAADAIKLGATSVVNVKAGRVGGYLEARRVHDVCRANGVPVWCGGMLETGIGRAANAALAALPGFTLPGDVSASNRFWARDIVTAPIEVVDGHVAVPTGPGLGVEIDLDFLDSVTTSVTHVDASGVRPARQ
jgi:O-succinylbenzoate synthase